MNARKKSLLIALVLGDGYINRKGALKIRHGYKQYEYIKYKAELCRSLTGRACNIRREEYLNKIINSKKVPDTYGYGFQCQNKYFRILRKWMYKGSHKEVNKKWLKYLDAEGLAIWYMDDGGLAVDKRPYKSFQGFVEFHTHELKENAEEIQEYFKEKWGLESHLAKRNDLCGIRYNVRMYNKNALKLIEIVSPYIIDSMKYKITIPEKYIQEREASQVDDDVL